MRLQALITLLEREGITVNTAAAINIEKVLYQTDLREFDTLSKLKYRVVPIISRNKEEQELLYKVFDRLDHAVEREKAAVVATPLEEDVKTNNRYVLPKKNITAAILLLLTLA